MAIIDPYQKCDLCGMLLTVSLLRICDCETCENDFCENCGDFSDDHDFCQVCLDNLHMRGEEPGDG